MIVCCPVCGSEDAYHNGVCYECPNCGNQWGDDVGEEDDDEDETFDMYPN